MRTKYYILLVCVWFFPVFAFAQFQQPIYAVRGIQQAWLRYNTYSNQFDSARVTAVFGEFCWVRNDSLHPLPFVRSAQSRVVDGCQAVGLDTILSAEGMTGMFAVPDSTVEFRYFRWLHVEAIPPLSGHYHDTIYTANSYDQNWNVGMARVKDTMMFKLVMVNAVNGTQIAVLDSVLIMSNDSTSYVKRFGTNPDVLYNTVVLNNLPLSTAARLKVLVYRWGPTPYGMLFNQSPVWVNNSALMGNSSGHVAYLTGDTASAMDEHYYEDICNYYDSVLSRHSVLPEKLVEILPEGHETDYIDRYFNHVTANGLDAYEPKYPASFLEKSVPDSDRDKVSDDRALTPKFVRISTIFPCDGTSRSELNVVTQSTFAPFVGKLELTDINGAKVQNVNWSGTIPIGESNLRVSVANLVPGVYFFRLLHSNGTTLVSKKYVR